MLPWSKRILLITILCVNQAHTAEPPSSQKAFVSTRVLMGAGSFACPVNPPTRTTESALMIAAPLIASAVGGLLSSGAAALSTYIDGIVREETSAVNVVSTGDYFYQLSKRSGGKWEAKPRLDCLAIARGTIGRVDEKSLNKTAAMADPNGHFGKHDGGTNDFQVLRGLGLSDFPEIYLELAIERDQLNTVFRMRPQFLYIRQPRIKIQSGGKFDLNVTLSFSLPGAGAPFAILPMHFPNLVSGAVFATTDLTSDNPWAAMPAPPETRRMPEEIRSLLASLPATPFNVTVTVEETSAPSKFLVFISQLLSRNNESIGKAAESSTAEILKNSNKRVIKDAAEHK
jgi:hypothetical protein